VQPTVRDLRAATKDLAVVTPRLARTFRVLNRFFNELAYDPPGDRRPFNFWAAWAAHAGATLFNLQDAHGPIRRGLVLVNCNGYNVLEQVILGNPQLGLLTRLLRLPPEQEVCPENQPPDDLVP
jgi:phospholipid/cholesterol/gamma-HCH transport system substrate-binding protein